MDSIQTLPPLSTLSSSLLSFIQEKLSAEDDLIRAPTLVSELQDQCCDLDRALVDLNRRLESSLGAYCTFSDLISGLFANINPKFSDLSSSTYVSDGRGERAEKTEQVLGDELPALAKEVARVETVRAYAETALKLDNLIGDIEDAVSSAMNKNLRRNSVTQNSDDMRLHAIKTLKLTEEVLYSVTKTRPQWTRLVSAVDHRADRALAMLRPQAIADHRALLASLGWPPPLSMTSSNPDSSNSTAIQNPLFTMNGNLKHQYCESFLALCCLQELQRQRKSRQLEGHNREVALQQQPLWAIEELVNPVTVATQRHFSKWIEKPEFIFALVYKITRDYVDSMDELLQPLVDEAKLAGYSCREEWISAMVSSLSVYLAKEIFPKYVSQLNDESVTSSKSQTRISWLHLVDLMISFDKRIKSLVTQSGIILSLEEDGNMQKVSSLSVFIDRPDWFDLWAEIELGDTLEKLNLEMENERNWTVTVQGELLTGSENYKAPAVCGVILQHLSSIIDRCRSLPTVSLRSRFLRSSATPILQNLLDCLVLRCLEAEGLTALTDDNALIKVVKSINAAHYVTAVVREWCEDVFFLELGQDENDPLGPLVNEKMGCEDRSSKGILENVIQKLEEFRVDWVGKLSTVALRGFDARSRDYMKNRKQWQEKREDEWIASKALVGALDYIQGKMSVIEGNMNKKDFVGVWRSLASGLDKLFFTSILMSSSVKFSDGGVEKFSGDLQVLFGVFRVWCLRPEGFFPKISEGLKLLKMEEKKVKDSLGGVETNHNRVRHLSVTEAEKIMKSRIFS